MALPDELKALAAQVSNWGRWGDDDERGTVNLIDAAAVRRGVAAVRHGLPLTLAIPLDQNGPQVGSIPGRVNPLRTMVGINTAYSGDPSDVCFSDDVATLGLQSCTHWDALAHISYDGQLYNGFSSSSITAEAGATRCGVDKIGAVVSRGVLLDIAAFHGVAQLEPGRPVTADDLDGAAERAGVNVEAGDVMLVRTGNMATFKAGRRRQYTTGEQPGLSISTISWLRDHDIGAVATDTVALEVFPAEDPSLLFPVHMIQLRDMGLLQGQNFDLEDLSVHCAEREQWTFQFAGSPEPFTGGLGAPVQPLAIL